MDFQASLSEKETEALIEAHKRWKDGMRAMGAGDEGPGAARGAASDDSRGWVETRRGEMGERGKGWHGDWGESSDSWKAFLRMLLVTAANSLDPEGPAAPHASFVSRPDAAVAKPLQLLQQRREELFARPLRDSGHFTALPPFHILKNKSEDSPQKSHSGARAAAARGNTRDIEAGRFGRSRGEAGRRTVPVNVVDGEEEEADEEEEYEDEEACGKVLGGVEVSGGG